MKESTVCAFSDTHGKHNRLSPPEQADILVFAGDASEVGNAQELWDFLKWFEGLPARPYLHVGKLLPRGIDVLVTHGAPKGALDEDGAWRCSLLRETIEQSEPKVHIFGHIHICGGQCVAVGNTTCYNVSEYNRLFA